MKFVEVFLPLLLCFVVSASSADVKKEKTVSKASGKSTTTKSSEFHDQSKTAHEQQKSFFDNYLKIASESASQYGKVAVDMATYYGAAALDAARNYSSQAKVAADRYGPVLLEEAKSYAGKSWEDIKKYASHGWDISKKLSVKVYRNSMEYANDAYRKYYAKDAGKTKPSHSDEL